jgi:hypothetical protein
MLFPKLPYDQEQKKLLKSRGWGSFSGLLEFNTHKFDIFLNDFNQKFAGSGISLRRLAEITRAEYFGMLDAAVASLNHVASPHEIKAVIGIPWLEKNVTVAVFHEGLAIGGYALSKSSCPDRLTNEKDRGKYIGMYGVGLFLKNEYRGLGIGHMLRRLPACVDGVDYIWGDHYAGLNNIPDWEKRRHIIKRGNFVSRSVEPFNAELRESMVQRFGPIGLKQADMVEADDVEMSPS